MTCDSRLANVAIADVDNPSVAEGLSCATAAAPGNLLVPRESTRHFDSNHEPFLPSDIMGSRSAQIGHLPPTNEVVTDRQLFDVFFSQATPTEEMRDHL
ncbi:hypothetical protein JTE90_008459 [Oedothorax gibbosus]|uniref:Uncharacterized protein n=1 Tax=Oedothorax gibbosus TaxID=931172 RepID=A0AAV6V0J2_9ARAC|nr:hypothetical protein JTE90_008459 [Oedothorax gibbosus]